MRPANGGVEVLAFADGRPAMLATPPGGPRLVVLAPLPFGTAPVGSTLLFADPAWHAFLAKTLDWLVAREP
jgi:hypothetical protein